jgi:hypothetical protein
MTSRAERGNALTFVLILISVIMTIIFAATYLQPISSRALDDHYRYNSLQSFSDAALAESVANLESGASPEFSSEFSNQGATAKAEVQQLSTVADVRELLVTIRDSSPQSSPPVAPATEAKMSVKATLMKSAAGWRVTKYLILDN